MRLLQFIDHSGNRRVGVIQNGSQLRTVTEKFASVYELACAAIREKCPLAELISQNLSGDTADYDGLLSARRVLCPIDHPDPARCTVSLTGLTHLGSAASRDAMHTKPESELTDSIRIYRMGIEGGKPANGKIGVQPEWAYKGDGRCLVPPEGDLTSPSYALDGGEEAEIAGIYIIADDGTPCRVGFALGNEFSDHETERINYLYLAHSKLRVCSIGPELLLGPLPECVTGEVRIWRHESIAWKCAFQSGESQMSHSIANLEHHLFKYSLFRRPGDVHIFFFGANEVSFGARFLTRPGDVFEIDVPLFGRPLRNALRTTPPNDPPVMVRVL